MNKIFLFSITGFFIFLGSTSYAQDPAISCGDLFKKTTTNISESNLIPSVDFIQASHAFFVATMTAASKSFTPTEILELASRSAKIARVHQLSKDEFNHWIEHAKLQFVRSQLLQTNSIHKIITIDQTKMEILDKLIIQMKLSFMKDYFTSELFIDEVEKTKQVTPQFYRLDHTEHESSTDEYLQIIQNSIIQSLLINLIDQNPYVNLVIRVYPHLDPNLRQVLYIYNNSKHVGQYYWSLQLKVKNDSKNSAADFKEKWTSIYEGFLPTTDADYSHLIPVYSADSQKIFLASIDSFKIFKWIPIKDLLLFNSKSQSVSGLPHFLEIEMDILRAKTQTLLRQINMGYRIYTFFFSPKTKSFLFFLDLNENSTHHHLVEIHQISIHPENDYSFIDEFLLEENPSYIYSTYYSFAEDGSFFKIMRFGELFNPKDLGPFQTPHRAEDSPFRKTKYYFPESIFQIQSGKK